MDELAARFEEHRAHLLRVAYRMLGSATEAEDAVQEAWLRLSRADAGAVANLGGWLTTVVARVCLDELRARRARREETVGDWSSMPIVLLEDGPEEEAALADSVGVALLVVLETLTPAERLAFVLHDMFAVPFSEIAEILERTPDAVRQLRAARAGASAAPRRCRTVTACGTASSWLRFSPPHGRGTSRASLRCSIPRWCSACADARARSRFRARPTSRRPCSHAALPSRRSGAPPS
jgi:RNA polymerase sigma factor (sigma-70 family)